MRSQTMRHKPNELSTAAVAASRQVWLAGLGAAVVSRDWLQAEAANAFRNLVKEGTVVESRAIRFLGDQLETSMTRANTVWRQTRATVQMTVRQVADSAVVFVREAFPRSLPRVELPVQPAVKRPKPATPVKRVRKATKMATRKIAAPRKRAAR